MNESTVVQSIREGFWYLPNTVNSFLLAGTSSSPLDSSDSKIATEPDGNNNDENDDDVDEDESNGPADNGQVAIGDSDLGEDESGELMRSSVLSSLPCPEQNTDPGNGMLLPGEDLIVSRDISYVMLREHWQAVLLGQEASLAELDKAIENCKALVHPKKTHDEDDRKWLVRYLIELRYRRRELLDVDRDPAAILADTKVILGHHFVRRRQHTHYKQIYCDHCSCIIWNSVQASYVCSDCFFAVHEKCVPKVVRICAHVVTTEHSAPIESICPEIGLAFQRYTCAECGTQMACHISSPVRCFGMEFKAKKLNSFEPRLCDYTGLYYCTICHWNDTSVIPARVMNNWDFVPRKVCRASNQQISLLLHRPIVFLEEKNPRLFVFVPKLSEVKRIRNQLVAMKKYLTTCRLADEARIVAVQLGDRRYLVQTVEKYSVADLVGVEDGSLLIFLQSVHAVFEQHIRNCLICSGKAYICELCNNDALLFPFDVCAVTCASCNTVSHRDCYLWKDKKCAKCARLRKRALQTTKTLQDIENGN
ncbi:differentially expressed in FDCP 8 homolog [Anopheles bellator]|uniref:differentially expressed in FDCP 8 homolog n=1 Tax=Anopheles bellator TaxID=139047 RepID=UPI00264A261A|nr:differentially expressed in FDCP 8 homolog [Anopheles bellator]